MVESKLTLRKLIKKRKPNYRRQDSHKKKKLSNSGWRKPKGLQSKMRLQRKSYPQKVKIGYGSPLEVKGMDQFGFKPFLLKSKKQLSELDKSSHGVILSSTLSLKNKLQIAEKLVKEGYHVYNYTDAKLYLKKLQDKFNKLKELKNKKSKMKKSFEKESKEEKLEEVIKKEVVPDKDSDKKESKEEKQSLKQKSTNKEDKKESKEEKQSLKQKSTNKEDNKK